MRAVLEHGCRIDNPTAHVSSCLVNRVETCRECVGCVDNAAVNRAFAYLCGNFLYVGAVGQHACIRQRLLIQLVVTENLLGILTDRYIAVADGKQHVTVLQLFRKIVKALDSLRVAFRHSQCYLVLEQVDAGAALQLIQTVRVLVGIVLERAVECVHLLGCCRDEHVAVRAFLDLGEQVAGGGKVERQGDVRVNALVVLCDPVQGLGHGGRRKYGQLCGICRTHVLSCTVAALGCTAACQHCQ